MFVPMSNPNQYVSNLLMLPGAETQCCGTGSKIVVAKYHTSFLNTDFAAVDEVVIDGTTYPFNTSRATTTTAGLAGIKSEVEAIANTLLGTNSGKINVSLSGARVHISTSFSSLKFQQIGAGTTNPPFVPVDARILGNVDSFDANFIMHCKLNAAGTHYDVRIKPIIPIGSASAFVIDWNGSTDEYNSTWPYPSTYTLPTGTPSDTTIVNGYVCFSVVKATGDTGGVLAVSITPTGGSAIAYSQTIKLINHTNQ